MILIITLLFALKNKQNKTKNKQKTNKQKEVAKIQKLNTSDLALGTYYIIPYSWFSEWKKFVSDITIEETPPAIDNSVFICKHQELDIDLTVQSNDTPLCDRRCLVTEEQWNLFTQQYAFGKKKCLVGNRHM